MAYLSAEERRKTIIDAAITVIAREGLARATTRRIADEADAPLGALHYCFRNKDELIQLVADQGAAMLYASFEQVDPGLDFEATVRASIAAMWQWVERSIGLQLALMELGMWRIRKGGRAAEVYKMWDRFGGDLLRGRLAHAAEAEGTTPAIPVDEIVRFINHRFDGLVFEYAASQDRRACQRQTELLADAVVLLSRPRADDVTRPARPARAARARRRAASRR